MALAADLAMGAARHGEDVEMDDAEGGANDEDLDDRAEATREMQQKSGGPTMGKVYLVVSRSKRAGRKGKGKAKAPSRGVIIPRKRCELCMSLDDTCQWGKQVSIHFVPREWDLTRFLQKACIPCQIWWKKCEVLPEGVKRVQMESVTLPQGGKGKKKAQTHSPEASRSCLHQQRQPSLAPLPEEVEWESLVEVEYDN